MQVEWTVGLQPIIQLWFSMLTVWLHDLWYASEFVDISCFFNRFNILIANYLEGEDKHCRTCVLYLVSMVRYHSFVCGSKFYLIFIHYVDLSHDSSGFGRICICADQHCMHSQKDLGCRICSIDGHISIIKWSQVHIRNKCMRFLCSAA